ncbi:putative entry exclusion protein TrbK-alt [Phenylobacterium aquaticum]|uniref:putative entry exclusion protein TrbK-alt n=1 Tax=Phenylobacterium aquaticum TaxID=1763816 RepID=UPI003AFB1766
MAVVAVAAVSMCGCSRSSTASTTPAVHSQLDLSNEQERCRRLGLKVYDDAACQDLQAETRARFLGKTPGRAP